MSDDIKLALLAYLNEDDAAWLDSVNFKRMPSYEAHYAGLCWRCRLRPSVEPGTQCHMCRQKHKPQLEIQ